MDIRVRTAVKNILRDRGVYIEKNSRNTIAQQLVNLLSLTRSPNWPIDELNVMRLNPDFKYRQIAEEAQHARTTRQSSHQPLPPTQRHTRYTQPSVPANSSVITTQQKEQDKKYCKYPPTRTTSLYCNYLSTRNNLESYHNAND
ncbi:hypothetical protein P3342_001664 [Pyrenophora teres f. teres]|nr:hypothetical protein P3342_001664 [Pyrenophora teres f. teres]